MHGWATNETNHDRSSRAYRQGKSNTVPHAKGKPKTVRHSLARMGSLLLTKGDEMKALLITLTLLATLSADSYDHTQDRTTSASVNNILRNIKADTVKKEKPKAHNDFKWAEWMTKSYQANK